MNKVRRKKLQAIIDQLEELKGSLEDLQAEEEEYRDNIPENIQILVGNRGAVRQMELSQQCGIRDNFFRHFQSQPMKIRIYVHLLTSSRISITVSSCSRET